MSLETEAVLDRRRQKRITSFWRAAAMLVAFLLVAGMSVSLFDKDLLSDSKQIARISVTGLIDADRRKLKLLKRVGRSDRVAGVVVYVNSPGGTTTGGEALFEAIRELSKKKPVVAQFGTVAASAAFIVGLATDHIVARGNTITGSVGVIMQWPEFSQMLDKIGIKMNEIKSGNLKATPSPFKPIDEDSRRVAEMMIKDSQRWFLDLVRTRRKVDTSKIPGLEAGRVYSGREALRYKLVDELGGESQAVRWLVKERKVPKGLKVVDWKVTSELGFPLVGDSVIFKWLGRFLGLSGFNFLGKNNSLRVMTLDGLVSVWQPGKS